MLDLGVCLINNPIYVSANIIIIIIIRLSATSIYTIKQSGHRSNVAIGVGMVAACQFHGNAALSSRMKTRYDPINLNTNY